MADRPEWPERQAVVDLVTHQHATGNRLKLMPMMPKLVGPEALLIDERTALFDRLDLSDPIELHPRCDTDAVGDDLTLIHPLFRFAGDFKSKLRRRDGIQVRGR